MDIHRCRFVPYPPQAINALAFSRPSDTQKRCPPNQRLAIGRANGDLEIWNPAKGLWSQETIFRGGQDRSIEGLAWTQDLEDAGDDDEEYKQAGRLRLFSIGFSSTVTEWDLARGVPARHANGNFGAIWCLAAQPRWISPREGGDQHDSSGLPRHDQYLAAGCEDGTIVLFSTDDGDLRYLRTTGKPPTKKPRVLSLAWKDRNTIVAGHSDSYIRVYDVRNRQTIRNMSLGKSAIGGNETLVWAVKCLANGTILSGDSAGDLKIWDGNNYSLLQRLHCHQADILDITTNANGSMIITGGADRRTVAYKLAAGEEGARTRRWAQIMHRRFHEHDVKALASYESQDMSVVVSAGLDTVPVVTPLRGWQKEYHRTLSHLPQSPQVSSAPSARLFISWWERQVNIWHVCRNLQLTDVSQALTSFPQNHNLLAQVIVKGEENIAAARISDDGRYLAVATVSTVKLFRLRLQRSSLDERISIRTKKLETSPSLDRFGARLVAFSPDSNWLCTVLLNNEVALVRIDDSSDDNKKTPFGKHVIKLNRSLLRTPRDEKGAGLGEYQDTVNNISFSADSRLLAVGDLSGRIATWVLEGLETNRNGFPNGTRKNLESESANDSATSSSDEDSSEDEEESIHIHGQRWRKNPAGAYLPNLDAPLLVMSFRPSTDARQTNTVDAEIGSHPTRHTPRPHAHDLPTGEDRLIAVTAEHKIVEFQVLQGRLTDWSRRNPTSYLPQQFQQIRERTMGCFWDVSNAHERLWLHGSTWMFMLDLAQDLPPRKITDGSGKEDDLQLQQSSKQKKKRKREVCEAEQLRKQGNGAGGPISLPESYVGVGRHVRKFKSSKQEESQLLRLDDAPWPASDEDEDEEFGQGVSALAQLRRNGQEGSDDESLVNGHAKHETNGMSGPGASNSYLPRVKEGNRPVSFLSLKYRSILGVVQIGGTRDEQKEPGHEKADEGKAAHSVLEVAVIERPLWDVELPPRFDGGQDWET
jgi:U3 small nucleolar RNA-associated protein 4